MPDVRHRQATADPQEQELNAVTYLRQVLGPSQNPFKMFLLNDVAGYVAVRAWTSITRGHCQES